MNGVNSIGGGGGASKTQGSGQQDQVQEVINFAQKNNIPPTTLDAASHHLSKVAPEGSRGIG